MRLLLSLIMLCVWGVMFAQPDTGLRPLVVPPGSGIDIPPATTPPPTKKSPSIFDAPPKAPGKIESTPSINFSKSNDFVNPNADMVDKLNKDNYKIYAPPPKKNQHLGDIRTKSGVLRISYRDYSAIDGDIVRVYVDNVVIIRAVVLSGGSKGFDIPIEKGFHKIDIEALSQGDSGPNTAEFEIYDDEGKTLMNNQWSLYLGDRASIGVQRD
jgi:hypothetical protein